MLVNIYMCVSACASWYGAPSPCNFLCDKSSQNIFCSLIWSLSPVPKTELLNPFEFPG